MTTPSPITKKTALAELRRIAQKSGQPEAFRTVRGLIEAIFDPRTPSYTLSPEGAIFTFMAAAHVIPRDEAATCASLTTSIMNILIKLGYRKNVLTLQEHSLVGSTLPPSDFSRVPYVPVGIFEGQLSLEEVLRARQLMVMTSALRSNYDIGETDRTSFVHVSLEPLDNAGRTIRDPRVISLVNLDDALKNLSFEEALNFCAVQAQKSPKFPFRRD